MPAHSEVILWAVGLVRERVNDLERARRKGAKTWDNAKHVHKMRVASRKLRAALEDVGDCIPQAAALVAECKAFADATADAQDAAAMIARLQKYRRFALPPERAEIASACKELAIKRKHGRRDAKRATKKMHFEMAP